MIGVFTVHFFVGEQTTTELVPSVTHRSSAGLARPARVAHDAEDDILPHRARDAICPGPERARASRDPQAARRRAQTRERRASRWLRPRPRGLVSRVPSRPAERGAAPRVRHRRRHRERTRRIARAIRRGEGDVRRLDPERVHQAVLARAPHRVPQVRREKRRSFDPTRMDVSTRREGGDGRACDACDASATTPVCPVTPRERVNRRTMTSARPADLPSPPVSPRDAYVVLENVLRDVQTSKRNAAS